jgi:hypothetical protein
MRQVMVVVCFCVIFGMWLCTGCRIRSIAATEKQLRALYSCCSFVCAVLSAWPSVPAQFGCCRHPLGCVPASDQLGCCTS